MPFARPAAAPMTGGVRFVASTGCGSCALMGRDPKSEKSWTIPFCACYQASDFGEARERFPFEQKAIVNDRDPNDFAFPFADKYRAGFDPP
jgi:hypothetical protein